jgi:hypothetical protein
MARRATKGAMKNRPAAKMRRTNWRIGAGFLGERCIDRANVTLFCETQ